MSEPLDAPATLPLDRGLKLAIAVTAPIVLFCAIYAALQARFVARDTAALRNEVEALHAQVLKIQQQRPMASVRAVPSPRPTTPRKGRKGKSKADGGDGEAKTGKRKGGKAKANAAAAEEGAAGIPARDAEGKPRRTKKGAAGKRGGKKKKKGRKKRKGGKAKAP